MGYRLHFAQHYAPEFKGGAFNQRSEEWNDLFFAKFDENGWTNDENSEFEVLRSDVTAYIEELKKLPQDDTNEYFPKHGSETKYSNKDVIGILEDILTSDDDTIRLEWF